MSQSGPSNNQNRAKTPPATSIAPSGVPYGHVPAYLPGSASLVEELDKQLMIVLRDGRHLVGVSLELLFDTRWCKMADPYSQL